MRNEFTKAVKREALARSGMRCEAIGSWYGLPLGEYCLAPLSNGVEFDHIILDANSKNNSLSNCAAVCIRCHKFKTAKHDIPVAAKTLRQQDRHVGIKKRTGSPMPGSKASEWKRLMDGTVIRRKPAPDSLLKD